MESPRNPKRVLLTFLDGTTHEADVVLGADGIKSSVRKFLVGEGDNRVAFSNTVAYRGLISYADLKAAGFKIDVVDHPICFMGPSKVRLPNSPVMPYRPSLTHCLSAFHRVPYQ